MFGQSQICFEEKIYFTAQCACWSTTALEWCKKEIPRHQSTWHKSLLLSELGSQYKGRPYNIEINKSWLLFCNWFVMPYQMGVLDSLEVHIFWEFHKNMTKSLNLFGKFCQILVALSEYMNFTQILWEGYKNCKEYPNPFFNHLVHKIKTKWEIFFQFFLPSQNIWTLIHRTVTGMQMILLPRNLV